MIKFAEVTESLNDVMKPVLEKKDTTDWFITPDGRSAEARSMSKDSFLNYYQRTTYQDTNGYYGSGFKLK